MNDLFTKVENKLNDLNISFQLVEHEPALTTEQADSFIEGIEGVRTKTMFLTNKKKNKFYLIIMDDKKRLDMDKFKEVVEINRIKMASEETLMEKMKLPAGVVSPFGLLNNSDHDISVFFDKEITNEERMSFHPNTNEKTIFISTSNLYKFIESISFEYQIIDL